MFRVRAGLGVHHMNLHRSSVAAIAFQVLSRRTPLGRITACPTSRSARFKCSARCWGMANRWVEGSSRGADSTWPPTEYLPALREIASRLGGPRLEADGIPCGDVGPPLAGRRRKGPGFSQLQPWGSRPTCGDYRSQ